MTTIHNIMAIRIKPVISTKGGRVAIKVLARQLPATARIVDAISKRTLLFTALTPFRLR